MATSEPENLLAALDARMAEFISQASDDSKKESLQASWTLIRNGLKDSDGKGDYTLQDAVDMVDAAAAMFPTDEEFLDSVKRFI